MIELKLPFPPSINSMFINKRAGARGRGRIISPEYRAWIAEATAVLEGQKPPAIIRRAIVHVDLDESRKGDCDNRLKPVIDLLVSRGVLGGDSKKYIQRASVGWESISDCRVRIEAAQW